MAIEIPEFVCRHCDCVVTWHPRGQWVRDDSAYCGYAPLGDRTHDVRRTVPPTTNFASIEAWLDEPRPPPVPF